VGVDREVDTGVGLGNMNTSAAAGKEQRMCIVVVGTGVAVEGEPKAGLFSLRSVADTVHNSLE
jgi:hypothetical protein